MKHRVFLLTFYILTMQITLFAESFRVIQLKEVHLEEDSSQEIVLNINYADAIGIYLPTSHDFLKGLEIELKIPQDLLPYRYSVGYALYKDVLPAPVEGKIDYKGTNTLVQALPPKLNMILQVPVVKEHGLTNSPYNKVADIIPEYTSPMIFRLLPLMKGLPDNIDALKFQVKIRPILEQKGRLTLDINYPNETEDFNKENILIYIDEEPIKSIKDIILPTGLHHLSIVSEKFRQEVHNFSINTAKTTILNIQLKDTVPLIQFVAPENSKIWFDDELIDEAQLKTMIKTTPGQHNIKCSVGDYEISRSILIEKGKTYTVSLLITLDISDSQ